MKKIGTLLRSDGAEIVACEFCDPLKIPMAALPPSNSYTVPEEVEVGWIKNGDNFVPPPPPTVEELMRPYEMAVQKRLDGFAQSRNYDGVLSACTYLNSSVPQFKIEAEYCALVRDLTWAKCYEIMDEVLSEQRPMPTVEELLEMLPVLEWPE